MLTRRTYIKRSPLRRVSAKRAKENRQYTQQRKAFLANHPRCWACIDATGGDSAEPATQVHHRDGREHQLLLDESKWMPVCVLHHAWIHAFPNQARQKGWLI